MKHTAYLFAAVAVIAAGMFISCDKEAGKVNPQNPVINENAVAVEGITLDKSSIKFSKKEESITITATITPEDASDKRILWKSSDEKVAKVSNGVVESVAEGTCTISATTYAGNFVAYCAVSFPKNEVDSRAVNLGASSNKTFYWSSINFGAESPEEFGSYFAWGELDPKTDYSWATYIVPLSGWCGTAKDPLNGVADIADSANDVIKAKWGEGWRMPTAAEVAALLALDWAWTASEGVYGYEVSNPDSGKSIFLPVAGYYSGEELAHAGAKGRYWTSTAATNAYEAWSLDFTSDGPTLDVHGRNLGFVIRPVLDLSE